MSALYVAIPTDCLPAIREALAVHLAECAREFDYIEAKAAREPHDELIQQQKRISAVRLGKARVAADECREPAAAYPPPF